MPDFFCRIFFSKFPDLKVGYVHATVVFFSFILFLWEWCVLGTLLLLCDPKTEVLSLCQDFIKFAFHHTGFFLKCLAKKEPPTSLSYDTLFAPAVFFLIFFFFFCRTGRIYYPNGTIVIVHAIFFFFFSFFLFASLEHTPVLPVTLSICGQSTDWSLIMNGVPCKVM